MGSNLLTEQEEQWKRLKIWTEWLTSSCCTNPPFREEFWNPSGGGYHDPDCSFSRNRWLQCLSDASRYFLSIENANITRMKRILRTNYNIEKVCDVNQISRQLVLGTSISKKPTKPWANWNESSPLYQSAVNHRYYSRRPFFSIMFGGNF